MKATEAKLLDFLKKSPQFVIPIYQRTYSWTDKECRQLWDDIVRTGSDDRISVHFIGSIVYIDKADSNVTTWEPLLVIDGQQRLTTVTLLIAALACALGETEPLDGFSAQMLRGYYLLNPLEKGERKFKLLLSLTDKISLTAIVASEEQPKEHSIRIAQNFKLFQELLDGCGTTLAPVCKGLAKLMMVDIKLKRGEDNPQLIFESMNSTGKELSQADLIRNYILTIEHLLPQNESLSFQWREDLGSDWQRVQQTWLHTLGKLKIDVRFEGETVRLTQSHMAALFQTTQQNISLHLQKVYAQGEIERGATHKESLSVRQEG
jgi:uncharacterized protein with ParB-like and HNH nuclease domain